MDKDAVEEVKDILEKNGLEKFTTAIGSIVAKENKVVLVKDTL